MQVSLHGGPTAVLCVHAIPPKSSWWVGLDQPSFYARAHQEFETRLRLQMLPPGVMAALNDAERQQDARRKFEDRRHDAA